MKHVTFYQVSRSHENDRLSNQRILLGVVLDLFVSHVVILCFKQRPLNGDKRDNDVKVTKTKVFVYNLDGAYEGGRPKVSSASLTFWSFRVRNCAILGERYDVVEHEAQILTSNDKPLTLDEQTIPSSNSY